MSDRRMRNRSQDPIEVAPGVFWVGFLDTPTGMTCNPYLVIDGQEAVVIDPGSRPDFPTVMMKILQTGCRPDWIRAIVYTHYDPDVCGSAPNFDEIIGRDDLRHITAWPNQMFIRHIMPERRFTTLRELGGGYEFRSGRALRFVPIPYTHSAGAFAVFDPASAVVFTSDLFGSTEVSPAFPLKLPPECRACTNTGDPCGRHETCPMGGIFAFHRQIFPSNACLRHALAALRALPFERLAPQHGTFVGDRESCLAMIDRLAALDDVGIDGVAKHGFDLHFSRW